MSKYLLLSCLFFLFSCSNGDHQHDNPSMESKDHISLINLAPGHFHASLVQKVMHPKLDSRVYVYAEDGPELDHYLATVKGFNERAEQPTQWESEVYRGADFVDKMQAEKAGDIVVISGNNENKTEYISRALDADKHVLADKPMVIEAKDLALLLTLFPKAETKGKLLYDIMTERYEISNMVQRELAQFPDLFGKLQKGSVDDPAVIIESVHHFSKEVAGNPIKRPAWFFDVSQQGESIVDVATHLVDLAQWGCFPDLALDSSDVKMLTARHWPTIMTPAQFSKVTQLDSYPDYLTPYVDDQGNLSVISNGEFTYSLKGIHIKIIARWDFEAPAGGRDTHYAIMKGSKADIIIRQGAAQNFRPAVYLTAADGADQATFEAVLEKRIAELSSQYAGLAIKDAGKEKEIEIPDVFRVGHEAHFGEVMNKFLEYLEQGALPDWEVPNMITKYVTTVKALEMAKEE